MSRKTSVKNRAIIALGFSAITMSLLVLGWLGLSRWRAEQVGPGIQLESIQAEIFYLDASKIVQRGPNGVFVLRFGGPVEFVPHHFRGAKLKEPLTAEQWRKHLGAPIVFNAGQFDESLNHLGWLKSGDKWLSRYRKPRWMGLLLSKAKGQSVHARIADLEDTDAGVVENYHHAVQSMMLLDHRGSIRVRDSDKSASRLVLAEDTQGRILVLLTQGAVTLADLARWLSKTSLGIVRAMNLDGGGEAQVAINTPELEMALYGQYGTSTSVFPMNSGLVHNSLPSVIAVVPVSQDDASRAGIP